MPGDVKRITVCGFGLIGGCMALDFLRGGARRSPAIVAFDKAPVLTRLRKDRRFRVECRGNLGRAVAKSDVIILSAPHTANEQMLRALSRVKNLSDCLIIDTGAVKRPIARLGSKLKFDPSVQFLPTHPMAGRERKGFENSDSRLFKDHVWYLDESVKLNKKNKSRIEWMIARLSVTPVFIAPEVHDELVSEISHLPQLISTILGAQINPKLIELAGPGLRSMLRLSGSPYSVWAEIIDQNRDEIIRALEVYASNVELVKKLIKQKKSLQHIFASATRSYKCLS